jgi:predicted nuclease of predicted toxin-antitoxin system
MRILIDECLNWRICRALSGHYCASAQKMGWGGLANGELLRVAEVEFDVLITGDRNLSFQQNVPAFDIAVVILHTDSTQLRETLPLMPRVLNCLSTIKSGEVVDIHPTRRG